MFAQRVPEVASSMKVESDRLSKGASAEARIQLERLIELLLCSVVAEFVSPQIGMMIEGNRKELVAPISTSRDFMEGWLVRPSSSTKSEKPKGGDDRLVKAACLRDQEALIQTLRNSSSILMIRFRKVRKGIYGALGSSFCPGILGSYI